MYLRCGGSSTVDIGRLDAKQLKFARAANGKLGEVDGLEWCNKLPIRPRLQTNTSHLLTRVVGRTC